jgi:hypothetical protein
MSFYLIIQSIDPRSYIVPSPIKIEIESVVTLNNASARVNDDIEPTSKAKGGEAKS